jgi:hypothetical protein
VTPATTPQFKAPESSGLKVDADARPPASAAIKTVAAAGQNRPTDLVRDDEHEKAAAGFKAEGEGHYRRFGSLLLSDLEIDERVQRPEIIAEVNKIAREFDENALGTATVSARLDPESGRFRYFVLDGRQRRAGALKAGYDGSIRVDVHYNLTLADEARLFRILNERRGVSPISLYRTALIEKNPHALGVQKILDDLGVTFGTAKGYSGAKSSVRLIARRGGATSLRWALAQVQKIYDASGKGGCYDAGVVEALYWLYDHHGVRIDEDNLYAKLASKGGGVSTLIGDAKTIQSVRGGRMNVNLIRAIITRYNEGKRSARTKLPDWTIDTATQASVDPADADPAE